MPLFLAGLILGAISGGVTAVLTSNALLSCGAGAAAAVLTWLGCAALIFLDD